jgi:hypothetical protein
MQGPILSAVQRWLVVTRIASRKGARKTGGSIEERANPFRAERIITADAAQTLFVYRTFLAREVFLVQPRPNLTESCGYTSQAKQMSHLSLITPLANLLGIVGV